MLFVCCVNVNLSMISGLQVTLTFADRTPLHEFAVANKLAENMELIYMRFRDYVQTAQTVPDSERCRCNGNHCGYIHV